MFKHSKTCKRLPLLPHLVTSKCNIIQRYESYDARWWESASDDDCCTRNTTVSKVLLQQIHRYLYMYSIPSPRAFRNYYATFVETFCNKRNPLPNHFTCFMFHHYINDALLSMYTQVRSAIRGL